MKPLLILLTLLSCAAHAALLQPVGKTARTVEEVAIPEQVKSEKFATPLTLTGAGKRVKRIVLVKLDVYTAAHYLDATTKMNPADAMSSIRAAKAKALHLTFLRDLDSGKIRNSFSDALEKNKVDLKTPVMQQVFGKLTFDVKEGQTVSLLGVKKEGENEILYFEYPQGAFQVEGTGIASTFWQIWFGEPEDGGLEKLKAELVGKSPNS